MDTSVAVIGGAGASGLAVIKELNELGIKVKGFEAQSEIGGVYAKPFARHMMLTTSSLLTPYSDFPHGDEGTPKMWTMKEYRAYLNKYALSNGIMDKIQFNTIVNSCKYDEGSGKFTVCTECNGKPEQAQYTNVVVCTGTHSQKVQPPLPGEAEFKGRILHSEGWKNQEQSGKEFAGKRVLVVGSGEMAADLCVEISKAGCSAMGISIRGKHGHLIPRYQDDGSVTDRNTNRCRYANHYAVGAWVGWLNMHAKRLQAKWHGKATAALVAEYNLEQGTSAYQKFGCKTVGFVEAIVNYGAKRFGAIERLEKDRAIFQNGEEFECDVILLCTGFRPNFGFLKEALPDVHDAASMNPNKLWKRMYIPSWGHKMAWIGFARPAFGALPPVAEMQSRFHALAIAGKVSLPSAKEMEARIEQDKAEQSERFPWDYKRLPGLVDMMTYNDDLAQRMGVMPDLKKIFFTNPRLWYHLFFTSISGHQYRLQGPGSKPKVAEEVLLRMPVGNALETAITFSLLLISTVTGPAPFAKMTVLLGKMKIFNRSKA